MYEYEIKDRLAKKPRKLAKKDRSNYNILVKKILQIAENPHTGKPLRNVLKGKRQVHIDPFVLMYVILEEEQKVVFLDFTHHDEAYR
jgi:YafQ family addiction module toxin component